MNGNFDAGQGRDGELFELLESELLCSQAFQSMDQFKQRLFAYLTTTTAESRQS